jgi:hypothetical protein
MKLIFVQAKDIVEKTEERSLKAQHNERSTHLCTSILTLRFLKTGSWAMFHS